MTTYALDKICKHSIRYAQPEKKAGPTTIYVPNEWFDDHTNPPQIIKMELKK